MVPAFVGLRNLERILIEETHSFNKNMTFCDSWWDMFDLGNGGNCDLIKIAEEFGPDPEYKCYLLYPLTTALKHFGREDSDFIYFMFGGDKLRREEFENLREAITNSYYENVLNKTNMLGISFLKHPQLKSFYVELNLFVPRNRDGVIFRLDCDRREGIVFRSIETDEGALSMYYNINNDAQAFGVEISDEEKMQQLRGRYKDLKYGWAQQFGYVPENGKFIKPVPA